MTELVPQRGENNFQATLQNRIFSFQCLLGVLFKISNEYPCSHPQRPRGCQSGGQCNNFRQKFTSRAALKVNFHPKILHHPDQQPLGPRTPCPFYIRVPPSLKYFRIPTSGFPWRLQNAVAHMSSDIHNTRRDNVNLHCLFSQINIFYLTCEKVVET